MRVISKLVMATAMVAALSGVASAKTLRIGLAEDPDILDPTLARTFVGRIVFASICDKLFDVTPELKVVPMLATSYEWAKDNMSVVFKLRAGVLFQDGTPFDAEAVKFNIERHLNMKGSTRKSEVGAVKSVDVIDAHTVRLNLSRPFAPLIAFLTDRAGMMVSPKAAKEMGDKFGTHPVCAGPFKFVERVAQDRIVLEKFDKYWDKANVHFDRVEFRPIVDNAARVANLQAGSLDMIERLPPTDLPTVRKDPKLVVETVTGLGYQGITINVANGDKAKTPLGQDPRVREALSLAIDREALNQVVFNGVFTPGNQWVPPSNPFYAKNVPVPKRDIAKAKALLKAAGHPHVTMTFMVPTSQEAQQVAQVYQAMAKDAGIDIKIESVEFATSINRAPQGDFEAWVIGWSGRTDPDGNLYNFVACKAPLNDGHYCNPALDKLLAESRATGDIATRQKVYEKIAAIVAADNPIIYTYHQKWIWGLSKKITGFKPYPDAMIRTVGMNMN